MDTMNSSERYPPLRTSPQKSSRFHDETSEHGFGGLPDCGLRGTRNDKLVIVNGLPNLKLKISRRCLVSHPLSRMPSSLIDKHAPLFGTIKINFYSATRYQTHQAKRIKEKSRLDVKGEWLLQSSDSELGWVDPCVSDHNYNALEPSVIWFSVVVCIALPWL